MFFVFVCEIDLKHDLCCLCLAPELLILNNYIKSPGKEFQNWGLRPPSPGILLRKRTPKGEKEACFVLAS